MSRLINPVERMLKKAIKNGEVKLLDETEYNDIWDKVEQDMEDYKIIDNYRKGISLIEPNKILIYRNFNKF
jgi:hypothetical protein